MYCKVCKIFFNENDSELIRYEGDDNYYCPNCRTELKKDLSNEELASIVLGELKIIKEYLKNIFESNTGRKNEY